MGSSDLCLLFSRRKIKHPAAARIGATWTRDWIHYNCWILDPSPPQAAQPIGLPSLCPIPHFPATKRLNLPSPWDRHIWRSCRQHWADAAHCSDYCTGANVPYSGEIFGGRHSPHKYYTGQPYVNTRIHAPLCPLLFCFRSAGSPSAKCVLL